MPASQCVCPGKAPPWSLTFTCAVIHLPKRGTEPQMEKVTSPRSPNWLAEPRLNTLPNICLCGFFSWHAHRSVGLPECRSVGWGWGAAGRRPLMWRKTPIRSGPSATCSTGSSEARAGGHTPAWCRGWVAIQRGPQGPWQHPCPSLWDLSNLHLEVMEPNWMLDGWNHPLFVPISFSFASRPQQAAASEPPLPPCGRNGAGGSGPSPCRGGPSMSSSSTLSGMAGGPRVGWSETCAKRLGPSARLRGRCPSIPPRLSWSLLWFRPSLAALPPLPKSSYQSGLAHLPSSCFHISPWAGGTGFEEETDGRQSLSCKVMSFDYC